MKTLDTRRPALIAAALLLGLSSQLHAQVKVTTYHNDLARTGQYGQETILTPANVNSTLFGKLFSVPVDGAVYAQPLYLSAVAIAGGTHNVLYVATEHGSVYALDADTGAIQKQVSLIPSGGSPASTSDISCGDITPEIGITGTPVIDPVSGTLYAVAKSKVGGNVVQYLHALDVTTLQEKFGGPVLIGATVPGTGVDASGGMVSFNAVKENQRAALLLQNGHVVVGWAAHCDQGPWHGWVISYNASTLAQEAVFNTSPNGDAGGVWISGGAMAADAGGNIYVPTGNGTWNGTTDFGDSIVKLGPPAGGSFPVLDYFTPHDQATLAGNDNDLGSGGVVLLPPLPSGQQLLTLQGKGGVIYLLDAGNLGKYCVTQTPACTSSDPQILQEFRASDGIWGTPAYWNGTLYWVGANDPINAYSFNANNSGLIATTPTSASTQIFAYSEPVPVISANGTANAILWALDGAADNSTCGATAGVDCLGLYAYDATNLAKVLYISTQAPNNRDSPGTAVKFETPIVANGKVYVGTQSAVSAFGLFSSIAPAAATPTFAPPAGTYTSTQTVTIADSTAGATIYYTTDGSTPTTASSVYGAPLTVNTSGTLQAIATAPNYSSSPVGSAAYTIGSGSSTVINDPTGFSSGTGFHFVGGSLLSGGALEVTNGSGGQATAIWYATPVNVQSFTTDFNFQLTSASADGFTFTIQNSAAGVNAVGGAGGALGYHTIPSSVAVKFDLYNNAGEGSDSTGFYTNGAMPTVPALDMTASGVNLHGGNVLHAHITYNGTTLTLTLTDTVTNASFFASTALNIPAIVAASTAYVGFTGGTGGTAAVQKILNWTYQAGSGPPAAATPTFTPMAGTYANAQTVTIADSTTGATIYYTTNGATPTTAASIYGGPITVSATETLQAIAVARNYSTSAVGSATYTINLPAAATPTFTPAAGTYTSTQAVTMADATTGAKIYYTTNGTAPTTASSAYGGPVTVSVSETLRAIAVAANYSTSAIGSAAYTINSGSSTVINDPTGFASGAGFNFIGGSLFSGGTLEVTNGSGGQATAVWYGTPVNVQGFATDFNFQITPAGTNTADGMTFTIQNAASGASAVGSAGGGLGYQGIGSSVAVKFDLYSNSGEGTDSTGFYVNGAAPTVPAVDMTASGVNLHGGDILHAHLSYNGTTLTLTLTDTVTNATFTTSTTINIPATVGANTAYVGFTGGTGGTAAVQKILNWTYQAGSGLPAAATPTFTPAAGTYTSAQTVTIADATTGATIYYTTNGTTPTTASTVYSGPITVGTTETLQAIAVATNYSTSAVGSAAYTINSGSSTIINDPTGFSSGTGFNFVGGSLFSGGTLEVTNGSGGQATAVWYATPVNVQSFATDFNFQITPAGSNIADGFTFTIQNAAGGASAVGAAGGGLGYQHLASSVAVKFDLYSNAGEGSDSTGFYVNGAAPTMPAVDMTASGVNLHSGDILHAHISYNGTTLTLTLTDTVTHATFTTSAAINIPATVGANTAYVGFTGGSGGLGAIQKIFNWTY